MLASPHTNSWGFVYENLTNGVTTPSTVGTSVTPGASSVEGSWTQIASAANIASAVQRVKMVVHNGFSVGVSKQHFLDFGIDPAGGSSYTAFFSDWACGKTASANPGQGKKIEFPCAIPAGATVAVRVQGSSGTAGTVRVIAHFLGKPSRPELYRTAAYSETLGAGASTLGASFTPGNAGWGSWASLGTTAKKHHRAQLGVQIDNATSGNEGTRIQLGIGDGTNMHRITDSFLWSDVNEIESMLEQVGGDWEIPAGAELWVRGNCSGAPTSGYNATAVLFGG